MNDREDLTPSLLVKLRAGDAGAGELLERLHRERLVRFCAGYLGSRDEAEDAASEVIVKALASREVPGEVRAWLFCIARNHCFTRLRDRGPRDHEPLPSELDLAASASGPGTRLARADDRRELASLLARLSLHERELLRLRYAEELSRDEIAQVLDLPASVVKSRLFEAVFKLRAAAGPARERQ